MEVRIENLTKAFTSRKGPEVIAVNNMNFTIPDGKLIGLLGPSGCGKSTTLYMIAGLHKPTAGHIYFGDEDVTNIPPENRGIGLVFQNYALYPHFSVRQNITFPLDNVIIPGRFDGLNDRIKAQRKLVSKDGSEENRAELAKLEKELLEEKAKYEAELANAKTKEERKAVEATTKKRRLSKLEKETIAHEMARIVDIERFLDRKPKELSGGQQQRVAIARALAKTPKVLLLDEPLSNLDARLRLQTREEIKRIQRKTGITTIFVTHDQEEAMSISDAIVVMKLGVVQQIGEPQYVYEEPANLFVAQFLGVPAINVFDGEIKDGKLYVQGKLFDKGECYEGTHDIDVEVELPLPADAPKDAVPEKGFVKQTVKDRKVKIGIRPESWALDPKGVLSVDVDYIENIGRDMSIVGGLTGVEDNHLKIIIPSEQRPEVLGKEKLSFRPKRFYVFEESGERIK